MPAWVFMCTAVIGSSALAALLLALARKRILRTNSITHNDVAGPILATIGTVLAVMMSFMVVGVWQEFDGSAQTVQTEASALADLHHLADAFPQPSRNHLKAKVDRYVTDVIAIEWPMMRSGNESFRVHDEAYQIEAAVTHIMPHNAAETNLQAAALEVTHRFLDARRERIHDNRQGIPLILWAVMMLIGCITVLFSFYFRVDRPFAQYLMVIVLTTVIAITFSLIAELDYPFRGDIAVSPAPFVHTYDSLHNIGFHQ